jgi:DNA repair protein RadC
MNTTNGQLQEIMISYKPKDGLDNVTAVNTSLDAYRQIIKFYDENTITCQEQMVVMYLNRANKPIGVIPLFRGGLTGTVVDIKLIISIALKSLTSSIVVSHNHPSGNRVPSREDSLLTSRLKEACKLLDLTLLDHLIITPDGNYLSYADEGML